MEKENPQLQATNGVATSENLNGVGTLSNILNSTEDAALISLWNKACSGEGLRGALFASAKWLEQHVEAINALNVFPVPDGDTGTNMNRTMEAAIKEIETHAKASQSAEHVGEKLSFGALMGARGNSGVILSQIIRGLADGFVGKENFTGKDLAHALTKAKEKAYRAVMKPVEGTMLTVVREASEAATEAAKHHDNIYYVLIKAVNAAREAVLKTPTLLPALREAGVVDAGGHGCYVLLEGALKHLRGEELIKTELSDVEKAKPKFEHNADGEEMHEMDAYGYCTNFMLITNEPIVFEDVRDKLVEMGQSAVIVGDDNMVKVHIHTEDPGKVISYATSLGSLSQIKLDNMQLQHEEAFGGSGKPKSTEPEFVRDEDQEIPHSEPDGVAVVAVTPGEGLAKIFKSNFGVSYTVTGGQTMNPSTEDLLTAVKKVPANNVIILPNNKNIIMVAQQIATLTDKKIAVVPTKTVPQGIAAMISFNFEANLDDNADAMKAAMGAVQTGEVTRAVRTATVNGVSVTDGQWIGLIDDELSLAADSKEDAVWQLLGKMDAENAELLTFYYGRDVSAPEAQTMLAQVEARYPNQSVEMVWGGQMHYHYIISVE